MNFLPYVYVCVLTPIDRRFLYFKNILFNYLESSLLFLMWPLIKMSRVNQNVNLIVKCLKHPCLTNIWNFTSVFKSKGYLTLPLIIGSVCRAYNMQTGWCLTIQASNLALDLLFMTQLTLVKVSFWERTGW